MKVDGSLGSLLQGVSQQPARDRFEGQCTLQENMSSNAVKGLARRQPTDLVGSLGSATSVSGWHNFQTRDGNKFLVMYQTGTVKVFNLNAQAQAVTVDANSVAYLSGTTAMKSQTDKLDNTVVVNPSVTVTMDTTPPIYLNGTGDPGAAIIQVLGGAYGNIYAVYIDGDLKASYRPPDGTTASDSVWAAPDNIAARLIDGLTGAAGTTAPDGASSQLISTGYCADWFFARKSDTIFMRKPADTGKFNITVADGAGGVNLKACTNAVTDIADLPPIAPHYYTVRVAQNADPQKDMWFTFIASKDENNTTPIIDDFGEAGYWKEAVAPDTNTRFTTATMPHKLTYNSPGFTFSEEDYDLRTVGTTTSNPDPSFVGNKINDVAEFQGRNVFLSGSNVIMSRTNKLINFWRGSASALADTDVIDINSTVNSSQMLAAVKFNKDLAVFTPKAQFVVFGRTALTPANAGLVLTTEFENEPQAHPVGAGRNVFFASIFGAYTGIREFYSESASDQEDSRPVTQHVNKYIVGKATKLTASATYDTLLVHTDTGQTDLYIYQYIWSDGKKVQSSWSTYKFSQTIVHSFFDADVVYLVQKIGNDYYLLRMRLDVQASEGVDYAVTLDQRFDVFECHTSFTLPYAYLATEQLVAVQGTGCPTPGLSVGIKSIVGNVVTLKKDMQGGNIVVGTRFMSRYMPTMPSVKDANGVVIGTAKMTARAFLISMYDTGHIVGRARTRWGDGDPVAFNARIVGDIDDTVGEQPLSNDKFTMPFRYKVNEAELELYTDSHLPMGLEDIEYVGQYNKRGRRIANQGGRQ